MSEKSIRDDYWDGVPLELRYMCLSIMNSRDLHYCTTPMLKYLDYITDLNPANVIEMLPYEIIHSVDAAFESCLFPLEFHEEEWVEHREDIERILNRTEKMLQRMFPMDIKGRFLRPDSSKDETIKIELVQRINIYFSVLYMYSEKWENLQDRLNRLLENTELNMKHLLQLEEAEKYTTEDDWAEFHYSGVDRWEPLNWLSREFLPGGIARRMYAQTYEKYAVFLYDMKKEQMSNKAWPHVCFRTENRLRTICEAILEEIEDYLEESKQNVHYFLIEKEQYEKMIRSSEEREYGVLEETSCRNIWEGESLEAEGFEYRRKWRDFTEKLRNLLMNNPSLPVVLTFHNKFNVENVDCEVGYVHDYETGEFKEKIISINCEIRR